MKKEFNPSALQQEIFKAIVNQQANILIEAVAGSGKSTTIVESLKLIPKDDKVLFLAFNKSIVEELKIKVGNMPNVTISTLHSLGMKSVTNSIKCKVQSDKYSSALNKALKNNQISPVSHLNYAELSEYRQNILKLVDLIRVNLVKTDKQIDELVSKFDLDLLDNEIRVAKHLIAWGQKENSIIDFTDMLYFPLILNLKTEKYKWVFIDECQDLNAAQRELFLRCIEPGGRFIAVGDPHQAIYGFAGADAESFEILRKHENTIKKPLSVSYRCGKEIVKLAKGLVPTIEAFENAQDGVIDFNSSIYQVQDSDMVLCRLTSPLTELCMNYISKGIKAYIKGRDIGANLVNMISKTKCVYIQDCDLFFNTELKKIAIRVSKNTSCTLIEAEKSSKYNHYLDKVKAIQILSEGLSLTRDVISRIESIFSDSNKQGICLSTIHKAKGLEADRVFILKPSTLYHKKAMEIDWTAEQEKNLVYVAYTRAKIFLGFIEEIK